MDDYVSFEIAKKLQEKGYSHGYNDFGYRLIYSDECTIKFISNIGAYEREYYGENISCPTISQVLKWLRNEKQILVTIIPMETSIGKDELCFGIYKIVTNGLYTPLYNSHVDAEPNAKYDDVELKAIEYVIDNLI